MIAAWSSYRSHRRSTLKNLQEESLCSIGPQTSGSISSRQRSESSGTSMTNLEEGNAHLTDLKSGPFSVLYRAVRDNTQVMVNMRNNHKLLGRVKAYDRHMNL